jgi:hypothetical protein
VSSFLLWNAHDMTDPQPKSRLSFIVDDLKNADEIHKTFPSKHNIDCF